MNCDNEINKLPLSIIVQYFIINMKLLNDSELLKVH